MKIIITGSDITGLIVANILMDGGHDVIVVDRDIPARSIDIPYFKYIENTKDVKKFLDYLDVLYCDYRIESGIMVRDEIKPCRGKISKSIQNAYWSKTRFGVPDKFDAKGINHPESVHRRSAISINWDGFRRPLIEGVKISSSIESDYDLHIATMPLWKYTNVQGSSDAMSIVLNLLKVKTVKEKYLRWDLVYTPFTPGNCIHRIYHYEDGYVCECSGKIEEENLSSDLNFLFPDGWYMDGKIQTTYGHLIPLVKQPEWPSKTIPVGVLAKWDDRISFTDVINQSISIAKRGY